MPTVFCLDIDSTVIVNESLVELGAYIGKRKEVDEFTKQAMNGGISFKESLIKRLEIMQLTESQLADYKKSHNKNNLTPGVQEFITRIDKNGDTVVFISGGFIDIVYPVIMEALSNKSIYTEIHCNKFLFETGVATVVPNKLNDPDGKSNVIKEIKKNFPLHRFVMIGDGVTDLETKDTVDLFIGFGGNVIRERVKEECDLFVTSFDEINVHMF
jgi:phosphoserine phosphatase